MQSVTAWQIGILSLLNCSPLYPEKGSFEGVEFADRLPVDRACFTTGLESIDDSANKFKSSNEVAGRKTKADRHVLI